nr:hypothetical protein [uncultured Desulfuromonas sp.]
MARRQTSEDQTLDLFSYEFDDIENDYNFEQVEQSEEDRDMFDRASALLAYTPLVNTGVDARRHPFNLLDQQSLSLTALHFSIHSVGLGDISEGGVQRETMIDNLVSPINEQLRAHPDITEYPNLKEIEQYALDLIKQLMEPVSRTIYHPHSKTFKAISMQVLKEVDDQQGNFYLRPSVQSTNLFLGSLKMSLTDDQFMLQALLEHQIERGLIRNAFQTARKLQKRTLFYKEEILDKKRRMSLNVRFMNWEEHVESKIKEIKETLPALLDTNRKILRSVQDNFELRHSDRGPLVAALIREIKDCIDIHKQLQNELQTLDSHYQKEQSKQSFYSQHGQTLPNMINDVLVPLMSLKQSYLEDASESLLGVFLPPGATNVYDLTSVVMNSLREKRVVETHAKGNDALDLQAAQEEERPNFSKKDSDNALKFISDALIEGPLRLSEIMSLGQEANLKRSELHAMALITTIYWPEKEYLGYWTIQKTDENFTNNICSSDDFLLTAIKGK